MYIFGDIANNLTEANIYKAARNTFDNQFTQTWLVGNERDRLKRGLDVEGALLRTDQSQLKAGNVSKFYSDYTVAIKRDKGQITSNVTLNDTGAFYKSFKITAAQTFVSFDADFIKTDGHIADNFELSYGSETEFEQSVLGLSEEDKNSFFEQVFLPFFINNFLNIMMNV